MKTHELKTWPKYFKLVVEGKKRFEVRKNDRDFKTGDILVLREWDPRKRDYTGNQIPVKVAYIMTSNNPFMNLGDCVIMSINKR